MKKLHSSLLSAVPPSHMLWLHIYFSTTATRVWQEIFFPPLQRLSAALSGAGYHIAYSITSTNIGVDKPPGAGLKGQDFFFLWLSSNLPAFAGQTGPAQLVSSVMERFHFTNLLGCWQREEEQPQVMNQAGDHPCLQEATWEGAELVRFYF